MNRQRVRPISQNKTTKKNKKKLAKTSIQKQTKHIPKTVIVFSYVFDFNFSCKKGYKMLQYIILDKEEEVQTVVNQALSLGLKFDRTLVDNPETGMYSIKISVYYETPLFTQFNDRTIHWSYYGKTI